MGVMKSYIEGFTPTHEALEALLVQYPWFSAARAVCEYEAQGRVLLPSGATSSLMLADVSGEIIGEESEGEIIDRFLGLDDYRIVAAEGLELEDEQAVLTEAELDEEDDLVSEELAEVYLAQGLKSQAIEIYRKLSLLNTEKSIYFAEKIDAIEKNS